MNKKAIKKQIADQIQMALNVPPTFGLVSRVDERTLMVKVPPDGTQGGPTYFTVTVKEMI